MVNMMMKAKKLRPFRLRTDRGYAASVVTNMPMTVNRTVTRIVYHMEWVSCPSLKMAV